MAGGRKSLLNEYWEHLLRLEALCQHDGLSPNSAAEQVSYRVPGDSDQKSKARWLRKYHTRYRARLQRELALGRQQPVLGPLDELGLFLTELDKAFKAWPENDTVKLLRQWPQDFDRAMCELAIEIDVRRA
jgi:hypothetical protein